MLHNSAEQPLQPCRACLQALKGHTGTQLLQNLTAASNFASCTPCQQPLRPSSALRKRRSAGSHLAAAVASRRRAQCPPRRNLQPPTWRGRRAAPPQDLGRSSVARPGAQAHRAGVEPAAWSSSRCREARAGARERATTLARRGGGLFLISYSEVGIWVWGLVWGGISLFGEKKKKKLEGNANTTGLLTMYQVRPVKGLVPSCRRQHVGIPDGLAVSCAVPSYATGNRNAVRAHLVYCR